MNFRLKFNQIPQISFFSYNQQIHNHKLENDPRKWESTVIIFFLFHFQDVIIEKSMKFYIELKLI